jgi:hypothetical protein
VSATSPSGRAQHLAVGQLRQQLGDRRIEREDVIVEQRHRQRSGDRFGRRGDAELCVGGHRPARRRLARGEHVNRVAPCHEHHCPGRTALVHVTRHQRIELVEPRGAQ